MLFSVRRDLCPFVATFGLLLVLGCGGASDDYAGTLEGTVTFEGSPVTEGEVSIYSPELGVGATAALDSEGRYRITDRIKAGEYQVVVLPPPPPPPQDEVPVAVISDPENIPQKSRAFETSGLSVILTEGENRYDISLMP